jgi:hypothetical protein
MEDVRSVRSNLVAGLPVGEAPPRQLIEQRLAARGG